eukprot:scaffold115173_cov63-Phaeocystis_antarctica.AAC.2
MDPAASAVKASSAHSAASASHGSLRTRMTRSSRSARDIPTRLGCSERSEIHASSSTSVSLLIRVLFSRSAASVTAPRCGRSSTRNERPRSSTEHPRAADSTSSELR